MLTAAVSIFLTEQAVSIFRNRSGKLGLVPRLDLLAEFSRRLKGAGCSAQISSWREPAFYSA